MRVIWGSGKGRHCLLLMSPPKETLCVLSLCSWRITASGLRGYNALLARIGRPEAREARPRTKKMKSQRKGDIVIVYN